MISVNSVETDHFGKVRVRLCLGVILNLVPKANRFITFRSWKHIANTGSKDRYFMSSEHVHCYFQRKMLI